MTWLFISWYQLFVEKAGSAVGIEWQTSTRQRTPSRAGRRASIFNIRAEGNMSPDRGRLLRSRHNLARHTSYIKAYIRPWLPQIVTSLPLAAGNAFKVELRFGLNQAGFDVIRPEGRKLDSKQAGSGESSRNLLGFLDDSRISRHGLYLCKLCNQNPVKDSIEYERYECKFKQYVELISIEELSTSVHKLLNLQKVSS